MRFDIISSPNYYVTSSSRDPAWRDATCTAKAADVLAGIVIGQPVPAPALAPASGSSLPELDATEAVLLLCSRNITARQYLESLFDRLYSGFTCLSAFQYVNVSLVSCPLTSDRHQRLHLFFIMSSAGCHRPPTWTALCANRPKAGPTDSLPCIHVGGAPT